VKLVSTTLFSNLDIAQDASCGAAVVQHAMRRLGARFPGGIDEQKYLSIGQLGIFLEQCGLCSHLIGYSFVYLQVEWNALSKTALLESIRNCRENTDDHRLQIFYIHLENYLSVGGRLSVKLLDSQELRRLSENSLVIVHVDTSTFFLERRVRQSGHFCIMEGVYGSKTVVSSPGQNAMEVIEIDTQHFLCSFYRGGGWALGLNSRYGYQEQ